MNSIKVFGILCFILCQKVGAEPEETRVDVYSHFSEQLKKLKNSNNIPGLSVAIVNNGQLSFSAGYGFADHNDEIPITADTPFWIASLTKTFVGLAYLHLEQDGKVNFNELASKTPEFTELCEWLASTTIPFGRRLDCKESIQIRHILHHQVNKPIGTSFTYNPIMYSRLSRHLEHSLGEGVRQVEGRHNYLAQTIDHYILIPAGMDRTMASMWDRSKSAVYFDMADGFKIDKNGNKNRLRRPQRHIAGGAGVVSTVLDLAKYDIAISQQKIASGSIAQQLLKPATFSTGSVSPYGFGWYFQCYKDVKLMWHAGWDPDNGYSAIHLRLPERNIALIMLANSEGLWWQSRSEGTKKIIDSEFVELFIEHFKIVGVTSMSSCGY